MKRTTKSLLLTALILFCAGVLLTLGSFLFVKIRGIDPYGLEKSLKTPEDKTVSLDEILEASPNANYNKGTSSVEFSKIEMTSFSGKVAVKPSEKNGTYLDLKHANTQNISYEIVGETLIIKDTKPVGLMGFFVDEGGFSYHGLRQIFGPGNTLESERTVTIYVDPEAEISEISVDSMVGNVLVDGVKVWNLKVAVSIGDAEVKNCTITDGKISVTGSFTDVQVADNHTASIVVSTKIGNIDALLSQPETTSSNFDVWMGTVRIKTTEPTAAYKMNCETVIGGVWRNGEKLGKKIQTDATAAARRVSSSAVFGSIYFDYALGREPEIPVIVPKTEPETTEPETAEPETLPSTEPATGEPVTGNAA